MAGMSATMEGEEAHMKIDLKKDLKDLYQPPVGRIVEVDVPPITYLAIDGMGNPNTSERYPAALESLYTAGYTIKFAAKQDCIDFVVGPLEGLWYADDPSVFADRAKDQWKWTMLIPLPNEVPEATVRAGIDAAATKKPDLPIGDVRVDTLTEGRALQTMHVGPYDDEGPVLERLHQRMADEGLTWTGPHHEIYLGDPRRSAPEKLRTVLRQPVGPA